MYARRTTLGKEGYALEYKELEESSLPEAVSVNWLITGGCGFIGTALIRSLKEEGGHAVRVVDNLSVGTREDLAAAGDFDEVSSNELGPMVSGEQVDFVAGDIKDDGLALRAAQGADVIVHFAANTGVMPSVEDPRGDCMSNVVGTLNYLEAARHAGVGRFIFASSGGTIVGDAEPPIHEEMPPHPVAPYGASKLAGEGYCSAYFNTFGVETVALRFGNVYGPLSGHKNSVVARFIKRALEGEVLEIYGDGTQTRDFIYVDDLIRAVRLSATVEGVGGEVFQIATSAETTVQELTDRLLPVLAAAGIDGIEVRPPRGGAPQLRRHLEGAANARLEGRSRPRRGPQAHRGMVPGQVGSLRLAACGSRSRHKVERPLRHSGDRGAEGQGVGDPLHDVDAEHRQADGGSEQTDEPP
jgi:UDP-glucose 4-epimerase